MKHLPVAIAVWLLLSLPAISQTTTTYRGVTVRDPAPYGAAGLAWQNNFKGLADRIGNHIEAAVDPTAEDDSAGTGGHDPVMYLSTWRNTTDNGLWVCVDASAEYATWVELTGIDWTNAPADLLTSGTGQFAALGIGAAPSVSYGIQISQTADDAGLRIQGYDDRVGSYAIMNVNSLGETGLAASGALWISSPNYMYLRATTQLDLQFSLASGATFFRGTPGNPLLYVYGYDAVESTAKHGLLSVNTSGQFQVASASGESLRLTANGTSLAYGLCIEADGTISVPNDNQSLTFGAAGPDDSSLSWDGARLRIFSASQIHLEAPLNCGFTTSKAGDLYLSNYAGLVSLYSSGGIALGYNVQSQAGTAYPVVRSTNSSVGYSYVRSSYDGVAMYGASGAVTSGEPATALLAVFRNTGEVGIKEQYPNYQLDVNGSIGFTPGSSVTPVDNGDVVFELTDNTTLTVRAKGDDGVERSKSFTLAP